MYLTFLIHQVYYSHNPVLPTSHRNLLWKWKCLNDNVSSDRDTSHWAPRAPYFWLLYIPNRQLTYNHSETDTFTQHLTSHLSQANKFYTRMGLWVTLKCKVYIPIWINYMKIPGVSYIRVKSIINLLRFSTVLYEQKFLYNNLGLKFG